MRNSIIDHLTVLGSDIVATAEELAPVDTGYLRSNITSMVYDNGGFDIALHITVAADYGIFQEFGTRNMPPHPFLRPAIEMAGGGAAFADWAGGVRITFAGPVGQGPRGGWYGLRADIRPGHERFRGPRYGELTEQQKQHVREVLTPELKRYSSGLRGRAKIAGMVVHRRGRQ